MQTIKIKVIKPEKMNQRAFEAALLRSLEDVEKGILKDFTGTTETWTKKPDFEHGHTINPKQATAYVQTDNEVYRYVNDGTEPHRIPKAGNARLHFQWGGKGSYKPKTRPQQFGSRPGGPSGPMVNRAWVRHPGTKAREFDKIIAKRWKSLLPRALRSALGKAAKASGHGIP